MRTCLRGFGRDKREFLEQLQEVFGCISFTYRESTGLAHFQHRSFHALARDGWLRRDGWEFPQRWKLACPESSHKGKAV